MIPIGITIKDVAKAAGLSIATVSKHINGGNVLAENKQLIEDAIRLLDFRVNDIARGLKTNKTLTVGILIPNFENIFFTRIVSNIENILLSNRYSTIICDYKENKKLEKEKLDFLISKMVDGIITVPLGIDEKDVQKLSEKNIPVVLIDRMIKGINCDTVLVDNLNASYNAIEHLINKGHRRIGIICGPLDIYTAEERLKGYIRAHKDFALDIDKELIKHGNYHIESGYNLLFDLIDSTKPPTAVFVTNYEMTFGSLLALNERNLKVPDDLSLIGFDNLEMAKIVKPQLPIVYQPIKQIGETAANVLLKRLKEDYSNFPSIYRLKTELLFKDTIE